MDFPSARGRAARRGHVQGSELSLLKLQRALARQLPMLALFTALGVVAGLLSVYFGSQSWTRALPLWIGTGGAIGLFLALIIEVSRDAIDLKILQKRLPYTVMGAAPVLSPRALRQLPPDKRSPLGSIVFQPASAFASAFRDLQDGLPNKTILAFIAPMPDQGATTAALCTALSAMQQGRRVVVIDCDLRQRALTRALDLEPDEGVLEACQSPDKWRDFIAEEPETGLHFIPAARPHSAWRSLVDAAGLPVLVENLRAEYDLIVMDCPPALGTADGALIARMADKNVVVAAWDETPFGAVRSALIALRAKSRASAVGLYVNRLPAVSAHT